MVWIGQVSQARNVEDWFGGVRQARLVSEWSVSAECGLAGLVGNVTDWLGKAWHG